MLLELVLHDIIFIPHFFDSHKMESEVHNT